MLMINNKNMMKKKIKTKLYFLLENYKDWYKEEIKTKNLFQQEKNTQNRELTKAKSYVMDATHLETTNQNVH